MSFFSRNSSRNSTSIPQHPPQSYHSMSTNKPKQDHYSSSNNTFLPNVSEMKKVFDKYDANKDGKISQNEYKAAISCIGKNQATDNNEVIKKEFEAADIDNDGYIDFNEFMEVQKTDGGVKTSDITNAFKNFDLDGDGKISAKELLQVLKMMGESCNLESCKKMVRGVDSDGDGLIDIHEFITMMTKTMVRVG